VREQARERVVAVVEGELLDRQPRRAVDDLHRLAQAAPVHGGAQDVVRAMTACSASRHWSRRARESNAVMERSRYGSPGLSTK
jgi:hypothetical protein